MDFPFDPFLRSKKVERLVMVGDCRRYYRFRHAKFYGPKGIITADASGCNLLCAYCWNYNKNLSIDSCKDKYYYPDAVAEKIVKLMEKHKTDRYRISGCEAILGSESVKHLAKIIKLAGDGCIVESNGIALGFQPEILEIIPKSAHLRITIKGDCPKSFESITGAKASSFKLQIEAIRALNDSKRPNTIALMNQFVDMLVLGHAIDMAGIELNDLFSVDVEGLLYYPQNIASMKSRGVKPLYSKEDFQKVLNSV
jgi:uncharacterized Fe-S cluster-containing radical SAM superfamily protein